MKTPVQAKTKHNYVWVTVGLCFLMVFTCLGFCSSNKGLYLSAITKALNIERSLYSFADSCRYISTAVINIFFGVLVSKFGTKKLICAGFLSLILSCTFYATASNVFIFYIGGALLGFGLSWTTTTMVSRIVNTWCHKNKGTVMGAILCANGFGGALAAQIITPLIYQEGNPFGYRTAYWLVTGILAFVCFLIMIFYKETPLEKPEAEVVPEKKRRGLNWVGLPFDEIKKSSYFYVTLVCIFCCGTILQGITTVAPAYMDDVGISPAFIATFASIHSLFLAGSKFFAGFLYDCRGLRTALSACCIAAIVTMILLFMMSTSPMGKAAAMLYTIFAAMALPIETVMLPILSADLFGQKDFDKILGIVVSVNTMGYATGAPLMNWVYDRFGSYKGLFAACAIIMVLVTLAFQYSINTSKKRRDSNV